MWFSVTLWTVLASLVCSTVAYPSSRHSGLPDYDAAAPLRTGPEDPRWAPFDDDYEGKGPWATAPAADTRRPGKESAAAEEGELEGVSKRESHSLSIVNPLDVLRQRLMLEMARRRMKENQDQIRENAVILKNLGKRVGSTNLRRRHVSNNDDFDV